MTWIGNIYQKFEAACQEVDDIVSQEAIKYVENHVQAVGESVKMFCSNVVQEAKAASVTKNDEIGSYFKSLIGIDNTAVGSYARQSHTKDISTYRVNNQQVHTICGLHLVNQLNISPSVDPLEIKETGFLEKNGNYLANEREDEIDKNVMVEEESVPEVLELISPGKIYSSEASFCCKLFDNNSETFCVSKAELPTISVPDEQSEFCQKEAPVFTPVYDDKGVSDGIELIYPVERESCTAPFCSELIGDNNLTVCAPMAEAPPANSVADVQLEFCQKEGPSVIPYSDKSGSSEAPLCHALINDNNGNICALMAEVPLSTSVPDVQLEFCQKEGPADTPSSDENGVPEVSELIFPGEREFFAASLCNELIGDSHETIGSSMAEVLPATSVPDVQFVFCQKEETNGAINSDDKECASDAPSYFRWEITLPAVFLENKIAINTNSVVTDSHLLEGSSENVLTHVELFGNPVVMAGHFYDSSIAPSTAPSESVLLCKIETVETGLASSSSVKSMESLEKDSSMSVGTTCMTDPQFHSSILFEAVVSSSDIGYCDDCISDIVDQGMETIELFDNVKVEEGGVVIDTRDLYAVIRARKFRSYKKILQDLFARKKRLVKEYEQLAVCHGDIDFGSLGKTSQTHLASTSNSQFDSKSSQTRQDSEWELL